METKIDNLHTVEEADIQPPPHYVEGGPAQIVTADTVRQGPLGSKVLYVLAASLLLVLIAGSVVAFVF